MTDNRQDQFKGIEVVGQALGAAPSDMLFFANVVIGALNHGADSLKRLRQILVEFVQGELVVIEAERLIAAGDTAKEERDDRRI